MESVGAYEAKTHLPRLLERVLRGESLTITRHGRPVARLVPVEDDERDRALRASRRILERRSRLARRPLSDLLDTLAEFDLEPATGSASCATRARSAPRRRPATRS